VDTYIQCIVLSIKPQTSSLCRKNLLQQSKKY